MPKSSKSHVWTMKLMTSFMRIHLYLGAIFAHLLPHLAHNLLLTEDKLVHPVLPTQTIQSNTNPKSFRPDDIRLQVNFNDHRIDLSWRHCFLRPHSEIHKWKVVCLEEKELSHSCTAGWTWRFQAWGPSHDKTWGFLTFHSNVVVIWECRKKSWSNFVVVVFSISC